MRLDGRESDSSLCRHLKRLTAWSAFVPPCGMPDTHTVERTLKQFLDEGFIRRIGIGRGAAYCKA